MFTASDLPPKPIETFVFMDLEATGLPPSQPKIAEMCLFAVNRHAFENPQYSNSFLGPVPLFPRLVDKLCICVNPDKPFTPGAANITGLDNKAFAENKKQSFNMDIIHMITAFLSRQYPPICLVAHSGCSYDFPLLKVELSVLGISVLDGIYCADTIKAMKALDKEEHNQSHQFSYHNGLFQNKKSYKLSDLYFKFYKEYPSNSHSAEGDVITLIRVFQQRARDLMHWMDLNARQFKTIRAMYIGNERCAIFSTPWNPPHPSSLQMQPPRRRLATAYSSPVDDDEASLRENTAKQECDQYRPLKYADILDDIKNMLLYLLGLAIITWIVLKNPV